MNPKQVFAAKVWVGVVGFLTYVGLMGFEMYSGKPLPSDAKTLMTAAFGVVTGVISHLMTQKVLDKPKQEDEVKNDDTGRVATPTQSGTSPGAGVTGS